MTVLEVETVPSDAHFRNQDGAFLVHPGKEASFFLVCGQRPINRDGVVAKGFF
jgi:hypothetical protein